MMNDELDNEFDLEDDIELQDNYDYDDYSSFDNSISDYNFDYLNDNNSFDSYEVSNRNDYDDNYDESYDESYNDDDDKNKYSDKKRKILKIILCLIMIVIIIYLIFIGVNNTKNKKDENDVKVITKKQELNYDEMFIKVKDSSLQYFDEARIKQDENNINLKTLKIVKLIDSIDDRYDLEKSTISISYDNNLYKLSITLSSNDEQKTKIYMLGHYDYCTNTYLCELQQTQDENITIKDNNDEYLYEYVKSEKQLSNWSDWSNKIETSCDSKNISCNSNDCLQEVKISSSNVKIGSSNKVYIADRLAFKTNGKVISSVCKYYDYIKINNQYYRTDNNSNYKDIGLLKKYTQSNYNNWIYKGRVSVKTPPNDTINTRYVFVDADYSNCSDTCPHGPNYYYDRYEFSKGLYYTANPELDCNNLIKKGIPDYSISEQKIGVSRLENNYKRVCYKQERTRSVKNINKESKWSMYNDLNLLNNNYTYSGNKKEK